MFKGSLFSISFTTTFIFFLFLMSNLKQLHKYEILQVKFCLGQSEDCSSRDSTSESLRTVQKMHGESHIAVIWWKGNIQPPLCFRKFRLFLIKFPLSQEVYSWERYKNWPIKLGLLKTSNHLEDLSLKALSTKCFISALHLELFSGGLEGQ